MPHAKSMEPPRGEWEKRRVEGEKSLQDHLVILLNYVTDFVSPYTHTHTHTCTHAHTHTAAHIEDIKPWFGPNTYQAISIGMIILLVVGIIAVVGGMAFLKNQTKSRKHFF